jgi:hypothetical protein
MNFTICAQLSSKALQCIVTWYVELLFQCFWNAQVRWPQHQLLRFVLSPCGWQHQHGLSAEHKGNILRRRARSANQICNKWVSNVSTFMSLFQGCRSPYLGICIYKGIWVTLVVSLKVDLFLTLGIKSRK